jgi:hypothetical protein
MYVRIITETRPTARLLYAYADDRRDRRQVPPPVPRLCLAGVEEDPAEFHIVRGID